MMRIILALLCLAVALEVQAQGVILEPIPNWTAEYDSRALNACLYARVLKVGLPSLEEWADSPSQPDAENEVYNSVYGLQSDQNFIWCVRAFELLLERLSPEPQPQEDRSEPSETQKVQSEPNVDSTPSQQHNPFTRGESTSIR